MQHDVLEFQNIHETFRSKIRRYLARLVGEYEAEDLTQEVFLRVSCALSTFRGESQLSTWIYRIATNAALDRLRNPAFQRSAQKSLSNGSTEQDVAETDDNSLWAGEKISTIEQQLVRKEMNECIHDFVERLPEHYRTILVLSEFEGLSNKEIAEILGVTLGTVKIRLHRARAKLKHELWTQCDSYWIEDNEFVPDLRGAFEEFRRKG
jgi:RNA polymerase sigma-70 factor, ECF subfamily